MSINLIIFIPHQFTSSHLGCLGCSCSSSLHGLLRYFITLHQVTFTIETEFNDSENLLRWFKFCLSKEVLSSATKNAFLPLYLMFLPFLSHLNSLDHQTIFMEYLKSSFESNYTINPNGWVFVMLGNPAVHSKPNILLKDFYWSRITAFNIFYYLSRSSKVAPDHHVTTTM